MWWDKGHGTHVSAGQWLRGPLGSALTCWVGAAAWETAGSVVRLRRAPPPQVSSWGPAHPL